jgi:hypothetical protein
LDKSGLGSQGSWQESVAHPYVLRRGGRPGPPLKSIKSWRIKRFVRNVVNGVCSTFGYEVRRLSKAQRPEAGFALYRYVKGDGSFDYERYRQIQVEGNKKKLDQVWVIEENIAFLSDYIKKTVGQPRFGLCHGTRQGKEQGWFAKYLGCKVIGTDISDTAARYPNTIQWDFHETKPEWIDAVDFIYSNSFDHSYDPIKSLNAWMSCIKPGGLCILEHTTAHTPSGVSDLDPFGAELALMPYLIACWAEGKYAVREILPAPNKPEWLRASNFVVIQRL